MCFLKNRPVAASPVSKRRTMERTDIIPVCGVIELGNEDFTGIKSGDCSTQIKMQNHVAKLSERAMQILCKCSLHIIETFFPIKIVFTL